MKIRLALEAGPLSAGCFREMKLDEKLMKHKKGIETIWKIIEQNKFMRQESG